MVQSSQLVCSIVDSYKNSGMITVRFGVPPQFGQSLPRSIHFFVSEDLKRMARKQAGSVEWSIWNPASPTTELSLRLTLQ